MPAPRPRTERAQCAKCGRELVPGSRFCNLCGAPTPGAHDLLEPEDVQPGDVLEGKWRIESVIGRGGMGTVYLATDVALGRKVAVKMLAAELLDNETHVARFEREARLSATLEHPKVILVYGVGRHHGRPFIVMKYLVGQTLSQRIAFDRQRGELMPMGDVRLVAAQVCAGLSHIHEHGLVHRDLKPSNIFLGPNLSATIIDFGILRDLHSTERLTRAGAVMGTPHYLSPEQVLGRACDHRLDLYSLGVILFELLTGKVPFDGTSAAQIFDQHVREPPPDACRANPAVPPEVGALLRRIMAKDPDLRPPSARELASALARAFAFDESPDAIAPTAPDLSSLASNRPTILARPPAGVADETVPMDPAAVRSEPVTTPLRPLSAPVEDPTIEPPAPVSEPPTTPLGPQRDALASGTTGTLPPAPESTTKMLWVGVGIGVATALVIAGLVAVQLLADPPTANPAPASVAPRPLEQPMSKKRARPATAPTEAEAQETAEEEDSSGPAEDEGEPTAAP